MKNIADFYHYETLDSTNLEARRKISRGIKLPAVFIADNQTAGRGRRGKSFFSDGGLYMSIAVDVSNKDTVLLTTISAVAVADAIEESTGLSLGIKWVNDLFYEGKKVCGILCEAVADISGKIDAVIIGIGVNLNVKSFPKELESIAGSINFPGLDKEELAKVITEKVINSINQPTDIIDQYKKKSIVIGKDITYEQNGIAYFGKAVDIDANGWLVVEDECGEKTLLSSGEITIRTI